MLDIEFVRENAEKVKDNAKTRGVDVSIDDILKRDKERRSVIQDLESARAEQNKISKDLADPKKREDKAVMKSAADAKKKIEKLESDLSPIEAKLNEELAVLPNMNHDSVKVGEGESANEVVHTVGDKPKFDFEIKDHEELGLEREWIDLESAANTSGSRFYYLKNEAVLLEFALVNWLLKKYTDKGFTPVTTPVLVKEQMMYATGFFPADKNEIYRVNPDDDDLYLVGTSEVTLAGLHMKKPIEEDDLPKRYVGFSSCFRREAGGYGKDTKGIFRVHQFDKVEMYSFCHPEKSWEEHDYLLSIEEEILQELELHYQVINIGSGDLGASAAKKYDCEVWIPTQERYRELTSCSNTTDFQARRGGIKYRTNDGKLEYAHTLNGTAMASTRTILALMENHQTKDGKIKVPKALQPYLGGKEEL